MNKTIIACAFATSLAACALPASITTAVTGINNTVATVQAGAVKACSFEPTESTIESLIGKFVPGLDSIQAMIDQICKAVTPTSLTARRARGGVPTVRGVAIRGRFVR